MIEEIHIARLAAAVQRGLVRGHSEQVISQMLESQQLPGINPARLPEIIAAAKSYCFAEHTELEYKDETE